jgi:ATP-binding cassette, subfamily B, bacterial
MIADVDAAAESWPTWRYVWRLHRFRPKRQLINLAGVLVGWPAMLLPGLAAKSAFDHISRHGRDPGWAWLAVPVALLATRVVLNTLVGITLQFTNGAFAYANAAMLQRNMLRRILGLPGSRALPGSPGEAISRFRDDTEAVVWYPISFNNVIGSSVTATLAITVMARINPLITLAVVLPLASVVLIIELARRRLVIYRRANRVRTSEVTGFIGDVFAAAQQVVVANAQGRVVDHFRELNAGRRQAAVKDRLLEEILRGAFWAVNIGTGLVLLFAGKSLRSGAFTVGDLALFVYYLGLFNGFVYDFGSGLAGYQQQVVSFSRMHELMAGRPAPELVDNDEIYERGPLPAPRQPLPAVEALRELRVEHLTYHHDATSGIDDINFVVEPGSFTVVTGRIGSGKTTLLQSVLGLLPASGRLVWNGDVLDDPAEFLAPPRAAYTPQVPRLFSESLEDNILLGVEPREDGGLADAIRLAVLDDDVTEMPDGLLTRIGSRGIRLSGGQIQRTAAARMFVRRPQLLVCDDLSSALDVDTESAVWEGVLTGRQHTVLAVSHRRAALHRADQVLVLRDGHLEDAGPLDQLLRRCKEMRLLWRALEED